MQCAFLFTRVWKKTILFTQYYQAALGITVDLQMQATLTKKFKKAHTHEMILIIFYWIIFFSFLH